MAPHEPGIEHCVCNARAASAVLLTGDTTGDQAVAALSCEFEGWRIWRGHDGHGQPTGWHATQSAQGRTVFHATDGPEELRHRLRQATAKTGAASHADA